MTERHLSIINPRTGESVGGIAPATTEDVAAAAERVRRAQRRWARERHADRSATLFDVAAAIEVDASALATAEMLDTGKPEWQARAEVAHAVDVFRYFAALARDPDGHATVEPLYTRTVTRRPYGLVAAILPSNFPLVVMAWKVAPALACGNGVLVKPHEATPVGPGALAAVIRAVVGCEGLVEVLPGRADTGRAVIDACDMVSFTGSEAGGRAVAAAAGIKPRVLELGGHAPAIVESAADWRYVAAELARSTYHNAGQLCSGARRVLVTDDAWQPLRASFDAVVRLWRQDSSRDPQTGRIGPMVSEDAARAVEDRLREAQAAGDDVLSPLDRDGRWTRPAWVLARPGSPLWDDEVFGPVSIWRRVLDVDEALRVLRQDVNPYGLGASIWTTSHATVERVARELHTGNLWANRVSAPGPEDPATPFGGIGRSGDGHELGREAMLRYSRPHVVEYGAM